jgi:molybdate transport system substrate-binding protein
VCKETSSLWPQAGAARSVRAWLVLLALISVGCNSISDVGRGGAGGGEGRSVSVAAASDLRYAFGEVSAEFGKSHPGIHILATYGSSGNFFAQLQNHAPFDLFLSADAEYPRKLAEAGLTVAESGFVYGIGRIAVWVPAGSVIGVEKLGMAALTHPSVKHIAIANPRHAPYGRAAESAMKSFGIYEIVAPRLVLGENVAQALQFVHSGNADIGIVALSLALAPPVRNLGRYWQIPGDRHQRLEQGGVILRWAKDRDAALSLRAFLTGPDGRRILAKYGFLAPGT